MPRSRTTLYYIKPAGHNTAWATHPNMFSYLPSNISHFNLNKTQAEQLNPPQDWAMSQSGAIIAINSFEFKHKIMKYAISCALTQDCIAPNYEMTDKRIRFGSRYNPYGNFDNRYCDNKYDRVHPFVCHRFDQSLWMILVANCYNFNVSKYRPSWGENVAQPDRRMGDG